MKKFIQNSPILLGFGAVLWALVIWGCSSKPARTEQVDTPTDMPDICQDIDFNSADKGLKEECGVTTRHYKAYRNIPAYRNLLFPKNSKIVTANGSLELRLEGFLPIGLPPEFQNRIEFSETLRRQLLKTRYHYFESFPSKATRPDKLIQIEIPFSDGSMGSVCYFVERPHTNSQRKTGYASRLLPLDCREWEKRRLDSEGG